MDGLVSILAQSSDTPSRQVAGAEALHAVTVALTELPESERVAICLCHLEGLSRKKAGARMGKSEAAVSALIYRALQRLRDLMGDPGRFFSDVPEPRGGR